MYTYHILCVYTILHIILYAVYIHMWMISYYVVVITIDIKCV